MQHLILQLAGQGLSAERPLLEDLLLRAGLERVAEYLAEPSTLELQQAMDWSSMNSHWKVLRIQIGSGLPFSRTERPLIAS